MFKRNFILLICLLSLFVNEIFSQVTIGSSILPAKGALLDIKDGTSDLDGTGVTASRGLGLPRVELQANSGDLGKSLNGSITTDETLDKDEHIGLLVYNVGIDESSEATRLCPGLHVWDGNKWEPIVPYPVIKPTKTVVSIEINAKEILIFI